MLRGFIASLEDDDGKYYVPLKMLDIVGPFYSTCKTLQFRHVIEVAKVPSYGNEQAKMASWQHTQ
ncbi:hypothetical protein NQ315_002561, partial [Exocentrus adspersus]